MGQAFGIDVGGSGIKGAPVDIGGGRLTAERLRLPTPEGAMPDDVVEVIAEIVDRFGIGSEAPVGVTIPGVVTHGVVRTAANIDSSWIGTDIAARLRERLGRRVYVVNDADAAGYAELAHGAARGVRGVVLVSTLGTGIGSALIADGTLVPNTELGHLEIDGHDAESRAAAGVREQEGKTWEEWVPRLQRYFEVVENLFWPDLIVIGGGASKKAHKFLPALRLRTLVVPAGLLNDAGIIGAADLADRHAE